MNYELFMAEAIAEARRGAAEGEEPIGCVAVIDDAMIARDHDRSVLDGDPTAHAVLLTLQATARKLGTRRLSEVTIFTTHEPCAMCTGALIEARVRALNLDTPPAIRYLLWLRGASGCVIGACDLGTSWITNQPVTAMLSTALPSTLQLVLASSVLAIGLGIGGLALGALALVVSVVALTRRPRATASGASTSGRVDA